MVDTNQNISIINFNVNGLNTTKRQTQTDFLKKAHLYVVYKNLL